MLNVAIIIGSTRPERVGESVARWVHGLAKARKDAEFELVDIKDYNLPLLDEPIPPSMGKYSKEHTKRWAAKIATFDAFIFVTPEYNHGYPAALKQAIDLPRRQWQAKPVAFVSYGGMSGGLRAVEQLRQVFAELHTVTVRDSVSFPNYGRLFDGSGRPTDAAGAEAAAKKMLDQLAWWASALRTARTTRPYAA